MTDRRSALGYAFVAAAATLWGCWALFLRPSGADGRLAAMVLMLVMSLPAPLVGFRPRGEPGDRRIALLAMVGLGVADAINAVLYFAAVQRGPVAVAVLTHYLAPILVALAGPRLLKERPSARALMAAAISLGGLGLVLGWPDERFPLMTALLGGGSAAFYAATVLLGKLAGRAYSPIQVTALHAPISAVVLFAMFGTSALPSAFGPSLAWSVAGAAICGLGAATLFFTGLARVRAQSASALTYLEPVTASLVGAVFFGEGLAPVALVGIAAVLGAGLWVAAEPAGVGALEPAP